MLNKNTSPYFDSFNEDKQFHQVLFRPSYPVQARELNELQSILQNQIERFGNHVFKEGSMVIPGQLSVDMKYAYVKIESDYNGTPVINYLQDLIDSDVILTGETSGVTSKIIGYSEATDTDPLTIFVKYMGSGVSGESNAFFALENIFTDESVPRGLLVKNSESVPTGFGSAVNIQRGVYFVRGKFVMVTGQTLVLNKYSNTTTSKVGLLISESFVTPEEDSSLLDNAQGSSNYAAPGAHRHHIDLTLALSDGSNNFVELISIVNGTINKIIDTSVYSVIEDTLARRTFDESGNYTVTPFNIQAKEQRNNDRGAWLPNTNYIVGDVVSVAGRIYTAELTGISGTTAPTHTVGVQPNGGISFVYDQKPSYNGGILDTGDSTKIALGVDAGKAYVLGHEILNQSTKFLSVNKALTFNKQTSGTIPVSIGSYVLVDSVYGPLVVTDYPTVNLYDRYITANGTASGTLVGTAVARYMEFDSGVIGAASTYVLSLIDVKMNSGKKFESDVRSIFFNNPTGADFTCNIQKNLTKLSGTVTTATASTTVNGLGTAFTRDLNPGDAIVVYNGATLVPLVVSTIASDTQLTLTANAGVTLTNVNVYKSVSKINEASAGGMIFGIPHGFIRKVRSVDNEANSNASYYTRQKFVVTSATAIFTISTASSTETFASEQQPDSFMVMGSSGAYIDAAISLDVSSQTATIDITGHAGENITIIATVRRVLKEKSKTLVRYYSEDITTQVSAIANTISLSKVDGLKIRKVVSFTSAGTPIPFGSPIPGSGLVEVDITNSFIFNGGQTDSYYGLATLSRASGSAAPASPIRIYYDYFEHGSVGDYFSNDSYVGNAPTYIDSFGNTIALRDSIDFRGIKVGSTFTGSIMPAIGFDFISDYTYYLPRIDKVYLTGDGTFAVIEGIASTNPKEPATPENSMLLATVKLVPKSETIDSKNVIISPVDNKRYTMRDIGDIDKRLSNVEYYTALSLLEQQTYNMQLFDTNGDLNFKNGFIVEPFTGQNIADVTSDDFRCSIDPLSNLMRPGFSIDNINLIESATSNAGRLAMHYVNNDNMITLPYSEVSEIVQPFASRNESITPYIKFAFLGDIKLTPNTDEWYETTRAPAVVIQQEGNYSALENAYRSQLGTVWNAWQTNWSSVASNTVNSTTNTGLTWFGNSTSNTSTTTTTTTTGQVRSGVNTVIAATYSNQVVADRIISVDILPYIRSRAVLFVGSALRPATLVYPFFETSIVSNYTVPASLITLTGKVSEFDTKTSSGANANHISRRLVDGNASVALSVGDVIHNGTANNINAATATAVVVLDETSGVRVVNVRGTFTAGQTVFGSISGVSAIFSSITNYSTLVTNEFGEVAGIFTIPSNNQISFLSGQRSFSLTSSSTNAATYSTRAVGRYTATGYLQTYQQTIVSTRNGIVQQTALADSRVLQNTDVSSVTTVDVSSFVDTAGIGGDGGGGDGGDPLAQSFTVSPSNGMFVTGVDVYFSGKDRSIPMWFNIVEMQTGLPTKNVVPGSHIILKPTQIVTSANGSVPTRIKMPHPIYLRGNTEYAFVMGSDSLNYSVWVSHLGENDIQSGQLIVRQPYLGSMFKSQNASTWDPSQMEDIKFNIHRANFDISQTCNAKFIAADLPTVLLGENPIFTTNGSNKIRVACNNNGVQVGSKVTLSGCVETNGIPAVDLNKQHTVLYVEFDSFVVQVTTNSTRTGYNGGALVRSSKNVQLDLAQVIANQLVFNGTSAKHFITPTSKAYVKQTEAIEVSANENTAMTSPMLVASTENEVAFMSGARSIETIAQLASTNSYISPVLDLNRYSIVAVGNRINQPSTTLNVPVIDSTTLGASTAISFLGSNINTVSAQAMFLNAKVGRTLTISGATNIGNNGTFTITDIASDGSSITLDKTFTTEVAGAAVTLVLNTRYSTEIATEGGSADAKYIIKSMTLSLPANQLSVYLDISKPLSVTFELYYRVTADGVDIKNTKWTLLNPVTAIKSTDNSGVYDGAVYQLVSTSLFDSAQIKLVQKSSDTTKVALTKNLRMIAMT